jgi:putative transposase
VGAELSNSLEGSFCRTALQQALGSATPTIFNTDQGGQFTAPYFTTLLDAASVQISMDGRGRVFDNIFIERLWRTVKYEHLYLYEYATVAAVRQGLNGYFQFYNTERPHQSLTYRTPQEVHNGAYTCSGCSGASRQWAQLVRNHRSAARRGTSYRWW